MILNESQAIEKIKQPKNKQYLEDVKAYESKLRVFTEEMELHELMEEPYWAKMNTTLKDRVNKKFKRVTQFYRFPLPVVQITDSVLNDYFKVFEGKNRFFNVEANRDISTLKNWIIQNNVEQWIEDEARCVLKNKPCSFVVVDRDKNGTPYLLNIDSKRLIDADINKKGDVEYIVFVHSIEMMGDKKVCRIAVYDDEKYQVFLKIDENYTLEKSVPHNLGYCPARPFISDDTNNKNLYKRRVAFGQSLARLEDWTFFDIFLNYVDHYAPFPITEAPIKKCANEMCRDGKVREEQIVDQRNGTKRVVWNTCQVCDGKVGEFDASPGLHIGIKLQQNKGKEDGSGKFKMHFPETDKMEYVPKKLDRMELEIRFKTVGVSNVLQNEAVNELQVKGSFASMETVLIRVKTELDKLYKWIVKCVGNLLYRNSELSIEANFGTEFYLSTEEELQKRFENAKKIGLPMSELILIYKQLIDTKYKGNKAKIERQKLLLRLDPLPLYSEKEAMEMAGKSVIDATTLNFKINFYRFVTRFEEENMTITEFGTNLEMRERIKIILDTLKSYNDEDISAKSTQGGEGSPEND